MGRSFTRFLIVALWLVPMMVQAQGLLVVVDPAQQVRLPRPIIIWPPHPPMPPTPPPTPLATYRIQKLEVRTRLVDQVARVQVSQTFENTGRRQLEVSFIFPLPYDGAIDSMTLLVDGKEYPAKLLDSKKARNLFEDIVRKNKDPALLEWLGAGLFRTSVFPVPPGEKRTVSLRYSQVCRKQEGLTDFLFPLSTAKYTSKAVEKIDFRVTIESRDEIKNVYSPTHAVKIKRPDDHHATITYKVRNNVPTSDFRLLYDVGKGRVGSQVLSYRPKGTKDGYFMLLASPKIKSPDQKRPRKTFLFVLDKSGSMSGKKIEQAKGALKFVIENLHKGDLFNIVVYDSDIEMFRPELQNYNEKNRKEALGFVEGIYAGGSTNIDGALQAALGQLKDSSRPSYVVFLTDGLPTKGETNEMKIVTHAQKNNKVRARIFAFGVGYDVNSRLLDRLVRRNHGQSEYVRPDEDIEDRVSRLYRRIESPVLTDVRIEFVYDDAKTEEGKTINRVYPSGSLDLFAGEQLVVVGRYKKPGKPTLFIHGKVGGEKKTYKFPAKLVKRSRDDSLAFVEKLWAVRRVGEILDELDLQGKNKELVEELVKLATRHGILTPYTSFLADENTSIYDLATNVHSSEMRLRGLDTTSGGFGFAQRAMKGSLQRANNAPAAIPALEQLSQSMSSGSMGGGMPGANMNQAAGRGMGGMGGGMMMGGAPLAAPAAAGAGFGKKALRQLREAQQTVRQLGNRTFYLREKRWIDSTLSKEQEKKATRVKQFSDTYFELIRRYGRKVSQYLVFDEPVLLNMEGQAYLIEP